MARPCYLHGVTDDDLREGGLAVAQVVVASVQATPGLGTGLWLTIHDASTNAIIVNRTNSGIVERVAGSLGDPSGFYVWHGTISDAVAYDTVWDTGTAIDSVGEVVPGRGTSIVTPPPIIGGGDGNGDLIGRTFLIKRNDTLPYLRRQLLDTEGNVVVIDPADTVKFTMRVSTDVAMAGGAKVHASAVIIDAPTGIVEYQWATGDTDTTTYTETTTLGGFKDTPYAAEFEVTRNADGKIETFPQNGYIAVSIPPDLDPGIDP